MDKLICPNCGAEIEAKEPKCPFCGYINIPGAEEKFMRELDGNAFTAFLKRKGKRAEPGFI